ncbi:MAG: SLBB domain-containing protein [Ignavibacteriaceae bacterium]|jgi:protein involved in polysaccharide export with SLBB domain|nr:SLBB domain-containing protein [Ignavibacteriaceae bacterium]
MQKKIIAKITLFVVFLIFQNILQPQNKSEFSFDTTPKQNMISVTIGGDFIATGTFPAVIGERVDQFVTRIFNAAKSERVGTTANADQREVVFKQLGDFTKRDIRIKKVNGQTLTIDLEKYRLTGDYLQNPYLQNDDVILFPFNDRERNFVFITGAINRNASSWGNNQTVKFQFVDGDRLEDAILLAGGIDRGFDNVTSAEISRLDASGEKEDKFIVNIKDNPLLKRGDRITILGDETFRRDYTVTVAGEVYRPGTIAISKGSSTLKEVIEKAGGFLPSADLSRAELIRGANVFKSTLFSEELDQFLMNRMAEITPEDSLSLIIDNKLRFIRGNGVIDFTKLSDTSSAASKFSVRNGDYIHIPEKLNLVYVFGQVYDPGYIPFVNGKGVDYYITKAGEKGQNAKDEIYLIKGKSRSWTKIDKDISYTIEPGDFIWLPKEPVRTFSYYLDRVMAISSIVTALATVLLLVIQFKK